MINKEFFQRVVIDEYLAKITPEQYFQDLERINSEPDPYDVPEIQLNNEIKVVLFLTADKIHFSPLLRTQSLRPSLHKTPVIEEFEINFSDNFPIWLANHRLIIRQVHTANNTKYSCRIDPPPSENETDKSKLVVNIHDDIGHDGIVKLAVGDYNRAFEENKSFSANLVEILIRIERSS